MELEESLPPTFSSTIPLFVTYRLPEEKLCMVPKMFICLLHKKLIKINYYLLTKHRPTVLVTKTANVRVGEKIQALNICIRNFCFKGLS
jgi:hypothetical protein